MKTEEIIKKSDVESYKRDGAVCIRNVLSHSFVAELADELDYLFSNPGSMSVNLKYAHSSGQIRVEQHPMSFSKKLTRIIMESPLSQLASALGETPVRYYMDQMWYKPKGNIIKTEWHQDTPYYNVRGNDLIRTWVCCDDVPKEIGLEFVKGSHLWNVTYASLSTSNDYIEEVNGKFSYDIASFDHSLPDLPDIEKHKESFNILSWDYSLGDVIVFNGNILHAARGDIVLKNSRRAQAVLWAGSDVKYIKRPGNTIPDPDWLIGANPKDGDAILEYDLESV